MFGKLSQIKNFITNAVTSLQSQRPQPPSDPALQGKLKFLLDFIFRSPVENQFKAYHNLQTPEMSLNELLRQIYHSETAQTDQIASILHFYTFLLLNCNNELVLCKIVSDSFVLQLTEVFLDVLAKNQPGSRVDVEEINSYKIALIKAYVSRINKETIKYMILNDRMRIFQNCIHLYEQYMKVEQDEQFGVESTCISNCILIIIRFLAEHQGYSTNICYNEGEKGVGYLFVLIVHRIHESVSQLLEKAELDEFRFELLKDRILFLIDLVQSISLEEYKSEVIKQTSKELADLRVFFKEIVMNHLIENNQSELNYVKNIELVKVLLKLLKIYFTAQQLLPLYQDTLLFILNKFAAVFQQMVKKTYLLQQQQKKTQLSQQIQKHELFAEKGLVINVLCSNMQILASILSSGQYLNRRNNASSSEKSLKNFVINILIDVLQTLLSEQAQLLHSFLCHKSVKLCLLSLMQLTVDEHSLHQYSVLKMHQFVIDTFKVRLKNSSNWDYIVLHYESLLKSVSSNLISVEQTNPQEYAFCQYHDSSKTKYPTDLQGLVNWIYTNECVRNFRFMIVQRTEVNVKDIKLEKNYHNNFISAGWSLQPGKELNEGSFKELFQLNHLSKGLKIPIIVIQDDQCLLFAHHDGQIYRIILNVRYKSIEGFTVQKEIVHIRLKGLQEAKQQISKFKEYLIEKRDKSRSRELKFIHHYLELYYRDNAKIIEDMGEAEILGNSQDLAKEHNPPEQQQEEPQPAKLEAGQALPGCQNSLEQKVDNL